MTKNSLNERVPVFTLSKKTMTIAESQSGVPAGQMRLRGVFGVSEVKNRNSRIYSAEEYRKHIELLKPKIEEGLFGELEHPVDGRTTIDYERVSHKVETIVLESDGTVTGSVILLDTPKGLLMQSIAKAKGPIYISSRAEGSVDNKTGRVTLETLYTWDLVSNPGFIQAKLEPVFESLNQRTFVLKENNDSGNTTYIKTTNKMAKFSQKAMIEKLVAQNQALNNRLKVLEANTVSKQKLNSILDVRTGQLSEAVEEWISTEYSDRIQNWMKDEYSPMLENWATQHLSKVIEKKILEGNLLDGIQKWIVESYSDQIQKWVSESYSDEVQKWVTGDFCDGIESWVNTQVFESIQKWITKEVAPALLIKSVEVNEKYNSRKAAYTESKAKRKPIKESLMDKIDLEISKMISESGKKVDRNGQPDFITKMPKEYALLWENCSDEFKRATIAEGVQIEFLNESEIRNFWISRQHTLVIENQATIKKLSNITNNINETKEVSLNKGFIELFQRMA